MPSPMVAVVAEDDHDTRELIRLVLEQSGFAVVLADDGTSAVAAVQQHNPVLTTLDVNMPGIDGFAAAKRLREFSQTYLIMITSFDSEIDVVRGFEAGADDYLVKPFRPRELRARADSMLRRARYTDQATSAGGGAAASAPAEESWAAAAAREFRESMDGVPAAAPGEARPQPRVLPEAPTTTRPAAQPQQPYQQPYQPPAPQPAPPPVQQPVQPVQQPVQPVQQPVQPPAAPAPQPAQQPVQQQAPARPGPAPGVSMEGDVIRYGGLTIDGTSGRAVLDGRGLDLTSPETEILLALLRTGQRVRSRADLVLAVRGQQFVTSYFVNEKDKRAVDAHVASLKRKLGDEGTPARWIEPVKGVGYKLVPLT